MRPTLDLAVSSGMDLATACDIISDNVSALGLEVSETTMLVDIMAKTSTNSNTTIEMMGEAFKYVAPVANTLGIDVQDLSTAIGLLGNNGIKSSQAGTVLRAGLNRLVKPTKMVKDAMDKYGISIQKDAQGNVELMGTVEHVREKLEGLSKTQKTQAIAQIFGTEAMSGWSAMINTSQEDVEALQATIADYNGTASEMANIMSDNLQGSLKSLKSAFEGVMISVGDILIPVFRKVVDTVTGVLRKFSEMDSGAQKLILAFGAVAGAIGPLMMLIGGIGGAVLKLIPIFQGLASGLGLTLTASTALIGGLSAVGIALTGLIAWVGSSSDAISYLQDEFGAFGTFIGAFGEWLLGTFQLVFGNIGILIGALGKSIVAILKGDFKEAGAVWKDAWADVENNTAKALSNINQETSTSLAKMKAMTSEELSGMKNIYDSTLSDLKNTTADNVGETAKIFVDRFKDMDNKTLSTLRGTSDTMAILLEGIKEGMDTEQATKKFTANLESMVRGGELSLSELEADSLDFADVIAKNIGDGSSRIEKEGSKIFEGFKDVATRGIKETSMSVANDIKGMSQVTFDSLSSMGGIWSTMFNGITDITIMSTDEIAGIIEKNYKSMGMTSEQVTKAMEQDMQLYIASQELAKVQLTEQNQGLLDATTSICNEMISANKENIGGLADSLVGIVGDMETGALERVRGMGQGFAQVFSGVRDDGSMSSGQMKEIILSNVQQMIDQGIPLAEIFKSDMVGVMNTLATDTSNKAVEMKNGVNTNIQGLADGAKIETQKLKDNTQSDMSETAQIAQNGGQLIKDGIVNGTTGTGEAVSQNLSIATPVQNEINSAIQAGNGAYAIKEAVASSTVGAGDVVSFNMSGVSSAVANETSNAVNIARANTNGIVQVIGSNTAGATNAVRTNMLGLSNIVANQTSNATNVAKQNASNLYNGVKTSFTSLLNASRPSFVNLYNVINNQTGRATSVAKQNASNMYNGVRTSFNSMRVQGTSAVNALRNSVVSATNSMRVTAINNWNSIRSAYGRTITGKIEITKTTRENKILSTIKKDNGDSRSLISDTFNTEEQLQQSRERLEVVNSLSNFRNNDTMKLIEEFINGKTTKKSLTLQEDKDERKNTTYITNNYTSPKQASLIELRRIAKRESRKLGAMYR